MPVWSFMPPQRNVVTIQQTNRARMDAEDPRIALAFEGKELYGETVQEIADELGVSAPRVYQLIARAREIGKSYRKETE